MVAANKKTPINIESLARAYTERSIQCLGGIVENGESEASRVAAASVLLDRGWGKPKQDNTHTLSGEVRVVLRKMLEDESNSE
jgi:hypothetical protein